MSARVNHVSILKAAARAVGVILYFGFLLFQRWISWALAMLCVRSDSMMSPGTMNEP